MTHAQGPQVAALVLALASAWAPSSARAAAEPNQAIIDVVERAAPAVVGLHVVSAGPAAQILGRERRGTGVLVDGRGHILTANYVVAGAEEVTVTLADGRRALAGVAGTDPESGLAVLRMPVLPNLPHVPLGRSQDLRLGQLVVSLASQGGTKRTLGAGLVSGFPEFTGYWEYRLPRAIQTNIPTPGGGSGAPLLDAGGAVVGVMAYSESDAPQVSFGIPVEHVAGVFEELVREGRVKSRPPRPWLGVYAAPAREGVGVAGVTPGGPADRADLRPRDIITQMDGKPLAGRDEFFAALWKGKVGDVFDLTVLRAEELISVKVRSRDRVEFFQPPHPAEPGLSPPAPAGEAPGPPAAR
jgi:S1-C subfamily serine protease